MICVFRIILGSILAAVLSYGQASQLTVEAGSENRESTPSTVSAVNVMPGNTLQGNQNTGVIKTGHYNGSFLLNGFIRHDQATNIPTFSESGMKAITDKSLAEMLPVNGGKVVPTVHPMAIVTAHSIRWMRFVFLFLGFFSGAFACIALIHKGDTNSFVARFFPVSILASIGCFTTWFII